MEFDFDNMEVDMSLHNNETGMTMCYLIVIGLIVLLVK